MEADSGYTGDRDDFMGQWKIPDTHHRGHWRGWNYKYPPRWFKDRDQRWVVPREMKLSDGPTRSHWVPLSHGGPDLTQHDFCNSKAWMISNSWQTSPAPWVASASNKSLILETQTTAVLGAGGKVHPQLRIVSLRVCSAAAHLRTAGSLFLTSACATDTSQMTNGVLLFSFPIEKENFSTKIKVEASNLDINPKCSCC